MCPAITRGYTPVATGSHPWLDGGLPVRRIPIGRIPFRRIPFRRIPIRRIPFRRIPCQGDIAMLGLWLEFRVWVWVRVRVLEGFGETDSAKRDSGNRDSANR